MYCFLRNAFSLLAFMTAHRCCLSNYPEQIESSFPCHKLLHRCVSPLVLSPHPTTHTTFIIFLKAVTNIFCVSAFLMVVNCHNSIAQLFWSFRLRKLMSFRRWKLIGIMGGSSINSWNGVVATTTARPVYKYTLIKYTSSE